MITSVITASGGFCSNWAIAAAASAQVTTLMLSRRKAILITSRMVALSSMKYRLAVRLAGASVKAGTVMASLIALPIRHGAGTLVEFAHGIEHKIGGRTKH